MVHTLLYNGTHTTVYMYNGTHTTVYNGTQTTVHTLQYIMVYNIMVPAMLVVMPSKNTNVTEGGLKL